VNEVTKDDTYDSPATNSIPMKNAQVGFLINVSDVSDAGEAMNRAAISMLRFGMDDFYVMVTDTDTGDEYLVRDGEIIPATAEAIASITESMKAEEDETDESET